MTAAGWVSIRTGGGIAHLPGFARDMVFRIENVSPDRVGLLIAAIDAANFFDRVAPEARQGARDTRTHILTIILNGRGRTLRIDEPVADETLVDLIRIARTLAGSRHQ